MSEPAPLAEPIRFGPPERPERSLAGFYHAPAGVPRSCGVVLCSPLGTDFTRSDRPYRHLAERLAAAGFPVLRFDPAGTGDSAGDEREPGLVRAWLADIGRAREQLCARSGASQTALVGLRLGATLAMVAASAAGGVDSLVLWNPCISGRAFVAEATKLHDLYERIEPVLAGSERQPGGREALGLFLPDPLVAELDALDLLAVTARPADRALVIDGGDLRARDQLLGHLEGLGCGAECQTHRGQKFLITVSHRGALPEGVLAAMTGWLSERHPPAAAELGPPVSPGGPSTPESSRGATEPAAEVDERAIRFGADGRLFGVLSLPMRAAQRPARPAIILTNAGTVNRVGPHRMYVRMARLWARLGFHVLRIDLSGIGDSPFGSGGIENLCYPPDGLADAAAAMTFLEEREIAKTFVIAGLCSGGDIAFQSGLRDRRVVGAVLMNPRTFCVLDLQAVEAQGGEAPPVASDAESVPRSLERMARGGVETLLVVSERDPGVHYLDAHFGDEMKRLESVPRFRRVDILGSDHTFTPVTVQARVTDVITEHLRHHFAR